jgi:hypothetical protein
VRIVLGHLAMAFASTGFHQIQNYITRGLVPKSASDHAVADARSDPLKI